MIIQEYFEIRGQLFTRTHSDAGRYIIGGNPETEYIEAIDPANAARSYVEGRPIEAPDISDEEALAIILGGGEA